MKTKEKIASAGTVATGTAIGLGGQTAAMAAATTFGTASTGTAISSLSGVAAYNASLAWLGGGTIAAGGGGMAAGAMVLTSIPVIGGAVAIAGLGYGIYKFFK
jgi:hypothetical protein